MARDLDSHLDTLETLVDVLDVTTFRQEASAAIVVAGTAWKALLDRSASGTPLIKPTKICGFRVTQAGVWAGNVQVRIIDGAGNKIFPFPALLEESVDFDDAVDLIFNWPVVVPIADGYIFQFRSTNAADGAGETLQLNSLDIIEVG